MGRFKIAIVERGKEALWRKYWISGSSEGNADEAPDGLGVLKLWKHQPWMRQSMLFDGGTQIAP